MDLLAVNIHGEAVRPTEPCDIETLTRLTALLCEKGDWTRLDTLKLLQGTQPDVRVFVARLPSSGDGRVFQCLAGIEHTAGQLSSDAHCVFVVDRPRAAVYHMCSACCETAPADCTLYGHLDIRTDDTNIAAIAHALRYRMVDRVELPLAELRNTTLLVKGVTLTEAIVHDVQQMNGCTECVIVICQNEAHAATVRARFAQRLDPPMAPLVATTALNNLECTDLPEHTTFIFIDMEATLMRTALSNVEKGLATTRYESSSSNTIDSANAALHRLGEFIRRTPQANIIATDRYMTQLSASFLQTVCGRSNISLQHIVPQTPITIIVSETLTWLRRLIGRTLETGGATVLADDPEVCKRLVHTTAREMAAGMRADAATAAALAGRVEIVPLLKDRSASEWQTAREQAAVFVFSAHHKRYFDQRSILDACIDARVSRAEVCLFGVDIMCPMSTDRPRISSSQLYRDNVRGLPWQNTIAIVAGIVSARIARCAQDELLRMLSQTFAAVTGQLQTFVNPAVCPLISFECAPTPDQSDTSLFNDLFLFDTNSCDSAIDLTF